MTAQQLKNSILQMAVQGKLVPQDPNDEPASVLLERIKAEKEALIKSGKIKKSKNLLKYSEVLLALCLMPSANKSARKSGIFRMRFPLRFQRVGSG